MRGRDIVYLRDIFVIAVTTFGGAQTHLPVMQRVLVNKRRYFTNEELLEFNALCQMLPGPSSTQTVIALSQKKGGVVLAILALLIWIIPACTAMTFVALAFSIFELRSMPTDFLQFVQPMAIGIIAHAGFVMSKQVIKSQIGVGILLLALLLAIIIPTPWTFPGVVVGAGIITNFTNKEKTVFVKGDQPIMWYQSWMALLIFSLVFLIIGLLALFTKDRPFILFENFFRFGSITFGGSNVLVPMMFEQFVKHRQYISTNEFLSGYALSQSLPGPSFSLATFTGGLALNTMGKGWLVFGCILGTVGIFLPGVLIIFFVYPFWQYLKNFFFIRRSLEGINAASVGLIFSAAVILFSNLEFLWINLLVVVATFCLLQFTRIKIPLLVLLALLLGFGYSYLLN